uniref:Peroxisomal sarcosine oxidase-like n=1 Tax=Phallusia mammillata TaxID=59560 RepID=A0A6F9DPS4_9ASCI|nr:peroxisomal sarcosine oxidase-like [Phallusia mammillata]
MYDVIVCGAGIEGSWIARQVAAEGKRILLLEQFSLPHGHGSSAGKSRIIRCSYDKLNYARMMPEAFKMWTELEKEQAANLLVRCPLVTISNKERLKQLSTNLSFLSISHEHITAAEVSDRFPGLKSPNRNGVVELSAGVMKADKCLNAVQASFASLGGVLHDCEKVLHVQPISESHIKVMTNAATYDCKCVILACGPWINKVLEPLDLNIPIKVTQINSMYWKAKNPQVYKPENGFPVIICDSDLGFHFYSTPVLEYPEHMKVSCHFKMEVDPDNRGSFLTKAKFSEERIKKIREDLIKHHFPDLIPELSIVEHCIQTETPDNDFVIDHHPKHENIIIAGGFSGHGYKLAPVVGKIVCSLALGRKPEYPVNKFALSRFNNASRL